MASLGLGSLLARSCPEKRNRNEDFPVVVFPVVGGVGDPREAAGSGHPPELDASLTFLAEGSTGVAAKRHKATRGPGQGRRFGRTGMCCRLRVMLGSQSPPERAGPRAGGKLCFFSKPVFCDKFQSRNAEAVLSGQA